MTMRRLSVRNFAFGAVVVVSGCAGYPGIATFDAPKNDAQHARASAAVEVDRETGVCSDPGTQTTPPQQYVQSIIQWANGADYNGQKYEPPSVEYQNPEMGYPKSLYANQVYGAVRLLILINADGTVASSKAICATRPEFVPYAIGAMASNRYRPARLNGKAVRDTALQEVDFIPHPYPH
jgi:outer membrane biosynthesis protein TonB